MKQNIKETVFELINTLAKCFLFYLAAVSLQCREMQAFTNCTLLIALTHLISLTLREQILQPQGETTNGKKNI